MVHNWPCHLLCLQAGEYEIESTAESTPTNSSLELCCLLESNVLTYANYFSTLVKLDLTGTNIVIFPPSFSFRALRHLFLTNCKQLEEILPLPLSIATFKAHGCTSLYGCLKLLVNMRVPSWEKVCLFSSFFSTCLSVALVYITLYY